MPIWHLIPASKKPIRSGQNIQAIEVVKWILSDTVKSVPKMAQTSHLEIPAFPSRAVSQQDQCPAHQFNVLW